MLGWHWPLHRVSISSALDSRGAHVLRQEASTLSLNGVATERRRTVSVCRRANAARCPRREQGPVGTERARRADRCVRKRRGPRPGPTAWSPAGTHRHPSPPRATVCGEVRSARLPAHCLPAHRPAPPPAPRHLPLPTALSALVSSRPRHHAESPVSPAASAAR